MLKPNQCSLCGGDYTGYGNNPEPLADRHLRCCDDCNMQKVLPVRIGLTHIHADRALRVGSLRAINQSSMTKCPHFIILPEHYRADETCRCDDPGHDMAAWGYKWDGKRWIGDDDDDDNADNGGER